MLFGVSFHNRFERLPKCVSWAPVCSKVVELRFEEPSTCSLSTLSQKLHVFVRGWVNNIVWITCKLTTLEWKLHCFFRGVFYEFKAPYFCSKFDKSSTENDVSSFELHENGQHNQNDWFPCKLTTSKRKLHGFSRVVFCQFKAPHFCSKFDQSSTENDVSRFELHENGQKSHDFSFHRKTRWFYKICLNSVIFKFRVRGSTTLRSFQAKV